MAGNLAGRSTRLRMLPFSFLQHTNRHLGSAGYFALAEGALYYAAPEVTLTRAALPSSFYISFCTVISNDSASFVASSSRHEAFLIWYRSHTMSTLPFRQKPSGQ